MSAWYRRALISSVTFIGGLYFFLEFVLPEKIGSFEFGAFHAEISRGVQVVGVMAVGLGLINILRVHGLAILRSRKGWGNSFALIIGLFLTLGIEGYTFVQSEMSVASWQRLVHLKSFAKTIELKPGSEKTPQQLGLLKTALSDILDESHRGEGYLSTTGTGSELKKLSKLFLDSMLEAQSLLDTMLISHRNSIGAEETKVDNSALLTALGLTTETAKELATYNQEQTVVKNASDFVFQGILVPLGASMFSLLAFYMASAAYRSFRIRSFEATIMMIAAVVVMLGQIPQGPIYVYSGLPQIRLWLLLNLSVPAFRAIFFGAVIAGLAMGVRMWLSLERSPLASDDAE